MEDLSRSAGFERTGATETPAIVDRPEAALAIYLLFAAVCCFLNLGGVPLISMEAMVVDGGAGMIESGNWAVPYLYGEVFTFKPALAPWMSAAAQLVVERPGELALRLPFALSGALLGLVLLLLLGRPYGWRVGLFTAMAAVGSALFIEKVRIAEYDTPLALAVGVAAAAALVNLAAREERLSLWSLAYLGVAAGFVAKGVPALMAFAPGLLGAALLLGRPRRLAGWRHLAGGALGLLLIGGYLWWAWTSGGPQVFDQPMREAQVRGLRWGAAELLAMAAKPVTIFAVLLPWSLAVTLWRPFRRAAQEPVLRLARGAAGFLLGGTAAFALLPTSQARYFLPLAAPMALVAGPIVATLLGRPLPRWPVVAGRALFLAGAVATVGAAATRGTASWPLLATWIAVLAAVALLGRAAAGASLATTLTALSLLIAVGQSLVFLPNRAARRDLRPAAERFAARVPPGERIWAFGPADCAGRFGSLFVYMEREVVSLPSPAAPPAGSYGVLVDWQAELLPREVKVETLALDDSGRHHLVLVRVVENPLEPPAPPPGLQVGDLCLCRFQSSEPPPPPRPPWRLPPGLDGAPVAPDPARGLSCDDVVSR